MQAIVSSPGVVGSRTPKCDCSRSKTASFSFGVTPTEPMPCTFEWPRIGSNPACGRPTMPRISARLAIACTFCDAVGVVRDAHRPAEDDVVGRA